MRLSILIVLSALLASCASGLRAPRLELGAFEHEKGGLDRQATAGVGVIFREGLAAGKPVEGWVGDAAIRGARIHDDLGGATLTGERIEVDLGTRFYPYSGNPHYQPFFGFGGTLQRLHLEDGDVGDTTVTAPGIYGVLGVEAVFGRLRLGLQYRHTAGIDAELGDDTEDTNLDGGTFMLTLGVGL